MQYSAEGGYKHQDSSKIGCGLEIFGVENRPAPLHWFMQ